MPHVQAAQRGVRHQPRSAFTRRAPGVEPPPPRGDGALGSRGPTAATRGPPAQLRARRPPLRQMAAPGGPRSGRSRGSAQGTAPPGGNPRNAAGAPPQRPLVLSCTARGSKKAGAFRLTLKYRRKTHARQLSSVTSEPHAKRKGWKAVPRTHN